MEEDQEVGGWGSQEGGAVLMYLGTARLGSRTAQASKETPLRVHKPPLFVTLCNSPLSSTRRRMSQQQVGRRTGARRPTGGATSAMADPTRWI